MNGSAWQGISIRADEVLEDMALRAVANVNLRRKEWVKCQQELSGV